MKFLQQPQVRISAVAGWVLLPMRLFLGITFVYAGIQKLTDPQYFNPSATGFIGKQIAGFAKGSPIHDLLTNIVLSHAHFFGLLVAYGEIAIGLGTLLGFLLRPAAFFGAVLSLLFFLSASWHVYPYFYGSDIVFLFCWLTLLISGPAHTGLPTVDTWLVPRFLSLLSPTWQARLRPAVFILLGVAEPQPVEATAPSMATTSQVQDSGKPAYVPANKQQAKQTSFYKNKQAAIRQQENRRDFLMGLVTGSAAMLGLALLWNVLRTPDTSTSIPGSSGNGTTPDATATAADTPTPTATSGSGTPQASNVIAHVSAVPANSATPFTLPASSGGDPAVLVHLDNGQFVAYDALCTHAGCQVDYDPSSKLLLCPCHGAAFDPANAGAAVQGPTNTPLPKVAIRVDSATGTITIQ